MKEIHIPVLKDEVLGFFESIDPFCFYLDGTFGRGGHCRAVLDRFPGVIAYGVDRDHEAHQYAHIHFEEKIKEGRLNLLQGSFGEIQQLVKNHNHNPVPFDAILIDLGVSSPQLDNGERGFSFYHDGPLDMRMDQDQKQTAAHIINESTDEELISLFQVFGEVASPYRVVDAIQKRKKQKKFLRTHELAELIIQVEGWRKKGQHPATQYFLALRLKVNNEIESLSESLLNLIQVLRIGGRLAVLTFHSLEDRIVKQLFRSLKDQGSIDWVNKKVIQVDWKGQKQNPRARSAKLRVIEKKV